LVAVIFVILIVFVGCSSNATTIVGEWYSEQDNMLMAINEDGTFYLIDKTAEDSTLLSGKYRIEGNQFYFTPEHEAEIANSFTLKGDILTLTYKEYNSTFNRVKK
jgi:hypothetical protein